ncbi:MAG: aminotransferase class V-fold PLP-dependent enzyme [Saprospiraceae bacterium]|nr:aminotransferase class V-fold PLP-dependent enzyme [Saprospiraceae bacterium]MDP4813762.1 aminotransferase class V-fold PLP-dependent enzyme [Saprospiraceae bacterium]
MSLQDYFEPFRKNILGNNHHFHGPFGEKKIVYADWTASGRLYEPLEERLLIDIAPYIGNTHTETTYTGNAMTTAYKRARNIIKNHVGADEKDILIASHSGMTGVLSKFQRILGLKIHEKYKDRLVKEDEENRPVVFVTHMEHHSNQTSWLETVAEVIVIPPDEDGLVVPANLLSLLDKYKHRKLKIAAVTSCSNVTGISTPYYEMAEIMHAHDGLIFVDFACSAPYININMHPENKNQQLDAIYFSPHKFLGGPGSSGILVFHPSLYKNEIPDDPGGGTVNWTNPWGEHKYIEEIEAREDGGTPPFLQTIRAALAIRLKEQMGVDKILAREEELLAIIMPRLESIKGLHILAGQHTHRLGVISFYIENLHYNLGVRLLNDRFGIQTRGGCSCAGTYGHYLLHVENEYSKNITDKINKGDLTGKPGWIRMSIHPTQTNEEINFILDAIEAVVLHKEEWSKDYNYHPKTNEFVHQQFIANEKEDPVIHCLETPF